MEEDSLAADQRIECGQLADSTISYACNDDMYHKEQ